MLIATLHTSSASSESPTSRSRDSLLYYDTLFGCMVKGDIMIIHVLRAGKYHISDCTWRMQQTIWANYKIILLRLCTLFADLCFLFLCHHDWPEGVLCDAAIEHGCARSATICRHQRHPNLTDRCMAANMHQPQQPYLRGRHIHYLQLFHLTWPCDRTGEEEYVSETLHVHVSLALLLCKNWENVSHLIVLHVFFSCGTKKHSSFLFMDLNK